MSETTPKLNLPYILGAQAQKHVTHNEAIRSLDAITQLSVEDIDLTTPPVTPEEGACYIVAAAATDDWAGKENQIAAFQDGAWMFYQPREGWLAWVRDDENQMVFDGSTWLVLSGGGAGLASVNPISLVGVNATADTTNRLNVSSPATLFDHEGDDHQLKINKALAGDNASVLFQTGYSGRAEFGLTGDDDFHMKVSPDGTTFYDGIVIDKDTGTVTFPNTTFSGGSVSSVFGRAGAVTATTGDYEITHITGMPTSHIAGRNSASTGAVEALTASQTRALINVEDGATADQSDTEIETAYNNRVAQVSGGEITAGTETAIRRFSPADVVAAIAAHETGGGGGTGDEWGDVVDADIIPDSNSTRDLGTDTLRFANSYTDDLYVTDNITVGGLVDGRDIQADGTKLDGITALADVTNEANVLTALHGATITSASISTSDKVLVQDVDDSDNLKTVTAQSIADLATTTATDLNFGSDAQGDITYFNGTNYARLAAGTSGQFLKTQGGGADPVWETIPGGGDLLSSNNLSDLTNPATARANLGISASTDLFALALRVADLEGDALGLKDGIADPFDDETDVDTATSTNEDYDAVNHLYKPALSDDTITGGTNIGDMLNGGGLAGAFNGNTDQVSNTAAYKSTGDLTFAYIGKDFSASPTTIGYVNIYGSNNNGYINSVNPTITVTLYGKNGSAPSSYNDGTSLGAITFADTTDETIPRQIMSSDMATSYDFIWIAVTGGTGSNGINITELEFSNAQFNNMALQSENFTADSTPATARLCLLAKPNETITLNTNLKGAVSRDGGTTFTDAVLVPQINYSDGSILYEDPDINISGQPSGTSMRWKVTTTDNKNIELTGVVLQWS